MTPEEFQNFFERVYVINLKRRPERLAEFKRVIEHINWPFKKPEVFNAIEGDKVGVPEEFKEGGGAYGCRQSHTKILEQCLMDNVKGWVLVFEDDATFRDTFVQDIKSFLELVTKHVPDAEGLMLGGQNHGSPIPLVPNVPGIKKSYNTQRTHAYACRGIYMRELYRRWAACTVHIDWRMREWQHRYKVYQPDEWLSGQAGGMSDIRGAVKPPEWWLSSSGNEPVLLLHASKAVVAELREKFVIHTGYTRDPITDIDVGLPACFENGLTDKEKASRLNSWLWGIQGECKGTSGMIGTIWHPDATLALVRMATSGHVYEVKGDTVDDILKQLPELKIKPKENKLSRTVLVLKAPADVVEGLRAHRIHVGYYRGEDGIDHGLREIFQSDESERVPRLKRWMKELQHEADSFFGTVAVFHPEATEELVRQCTDKRVVSLESDELLDAVNKWEAIEDHSETEVKVKIEEKPEVVVLLKTSKKVADQLRGFGFHRGNWCNKITGIDDGIRDAMKSKDAATKIAEIYKVWLKPEAEVMEDGVVTFFHPEMTKEFLEQSLKVKVVEIMAQTFEEAMKEFKK